MIYNNLYEASQNLECQIKILNKRKRKSFGEFDLYPNNAKDVCCESYKHWVPCQDYCWKTDKQSKYYNFIKNDILLSMKNSTFVPFNGGDGCGPFNSKCSINAVHWDKTCKKKNTKEYFEGTLGVVSTVYPDANGHFLQESLPHWIRFLKSTNATVLVSESKIQKRFYDYFVTHLGYEKKRFYIKNGPVRASSLIFYRPFPKYVGDMIFRPLVVRSPDDYSILQKYMRPHCIEKYKTLLMIDREKSRSFKNRNNITKLLKTYSSQMNLTFEVKKLGKNSVYEEACLFQRARIVFGVHGAGFANMIFSRKNTTIIEVGYTEGMSTPQIYFDQSRFLGLKYYSLIGFGSYTGQVRVPIERITDVFRQISFTQ